MIDCLCLSLLYYTLIFEFVKEEPSCEDDQNVDRCNEQEDIDENSQQHNDEHVREELRSN